MDIKDILEKGPLSETVEVWGWIRSVRKARTFSFLMVGDGSCLSSLQVVADNKLENYEEVAAIHTGAACRIRGLVVASRGKGQAVELSAHAVEIIGPSAEDYPIQKKSLSLEFLREKAHLRPRTNLFGAIFRLRHHLSLATHHFFHERGFYYIHSPILTAVDAEGAGEQFTVTALDLSARGIDVEKDYFGQKVSLSVSGQLEAECCSAGLGKVYTFGPTFRSENSNTARHLAEFWMVEPEASFFDLDDNRRLAVDYFKYLLGHALMACKEEMAFLASREEAPKNHLSNLEQLCESEFKKITYTEAIEVLKKSGKTFSFRPKWGADLQTEHERFLTEVYFKSPLVVVDYPREIKAFYMYQNDDGKTVQAMDVLVPRVGEIIGGSRREERLPRLLSRMKEMGMDTAPLWWYLDLRRYGSVPHSGFGLGLERVLMYTSGMKNIRDVIPFPRTPRHCDF